MNPSEKVSVNFKNNLFIASKINVVSLDNDKKSKNTYESNFQINNASDSTQSKSTNFVISHYEYSIQNKNFNITASNTKEKNSKLQNVSNMNNVFLENIFLRVEDNIVNSQPIKKSNSKKGYQENYKNKNDEDSFILDNSNSNKNKSSDNNYSYNNFAVCKVIKSLEIINSNSSFTISDIAYQFNRNNIHNKSGKGDSSKNSNNCNSNNIILNYNNNNSSNSNNKNISLTKKRSLSYIKGKSGFSEYSSDFFKDNMLLLGDLKKTNKRPNSSFNLKLSTKNSIKLEESKNFTLKKIKNNLLSESSESQNYNKNIKCLNNINTKKNILKETAISISIINNVIKNMLNINSNKKTNIDNNFYKQESSISYSSASFAKALKITDLYKNSEEILYSDYFNFLSCNIIDTICSDKGSTYMQKILNTKLDNNILEDLYKKVSKYYIII